MAKASTIQTKLGGAEMKRLFKALMIIVSFTFAIACEINPNPIIQINDDSTDASIITDDKVFPIDICLEDKQIVSEFINCLVKDEDFMKIIQSIAEDGKSVEKRTNIQYSISCYLSNNGELHQTVSRDMFEDISDVPFALAPLKAVCEKYGDKYGFYGFFPLTSIELYKKSTDDAYEYSILFQGLYWNNERTEWKKVVLEYRTDCGKEMIPDLHIIEDRISNKDYIEIDDHFSVLYINY